MKDFYYILGTASNCTPDEINEAYRKLALKFAPGTFENDVFLESHFKDITEAYVVLSDPERRRKYDHALRHGDLRHARYFKMSYLNTGVTLALILFTVLFGRYVMQVIKEPVAVKVSPATSAVKPVLAPQPQRHHRKHRVALVKATVPSKKISHLDTAVSPAPKPVAAIVKKQAPVAIGPAPEANPGYEAYLKDDISGPVYLHGQADYMSDVLSILPHHVRIRILGTEGNFYKIVYNGRQGYVPRSTVDAQ